MRSTLVFCLFLLGGCDIFQPASIPDGNSDQNDTCEKQVWYVDFDGDGYGTDELELLACDQPSGSVDIAGDCDDMDPDINPSAEEICDGLDNDCNGVVDDNVISDAWYVDADGDGYGNADMAQECNGQDFLVTNGDDCDDLDATISPDASEICDNIDNDCDGMTDDQDDDVEGGVTWYGDTDGDGYGNVEITTMACLQPTDFVAEGTDCNDNDVDTNPGATEYCDEQDNDCDGEVDEGLLNTYYADNDGDGYGDAVSTVEACLVPSGFVVDATDCNDADASVNPGAEEICDDIDNNCDGQISEGLLFTWVYADDDGDGFGNNSDTSSTCNDTLPTEYGVWVWDNTDCDDTDPAINPNADEYCDGVDNDCDGSLDESDALDASTWYADSDSDGYGNASVNSTSCYAPLGYVMDNTDCDDSESAANPGAIELCDSMDNDCDRVVDEDDAADASTWYEDLDSDGYGNASVYSVSCYAPSGTVADDTDCNDIAANVHPDAREYCDTLDNDCDGAVDEDLGAMYFADGDGDGYGDAFTSAEACSAPEGYVPDDSDCDDTSADTFPGADEYCDGVDSDCDGEVDEDDALDASTWYADSDSDGYGDVSMSLVACTIPSGYTVDSTDCNDTSVDTFPGADEYCDGVDTDCDGSLDESDALDASTWYADSDSDGYGDAENTMNACEQPFGYLEDNSDCDDADAGTYPGALEVCGDGVDQDCDGTVDETDCLYEGVYEGSFSITVNDEMGWGLSDVCEGDIVLDVDVMTDPMIEGNVVCTFSGALAYYYAGDVIGTVEADILSDLTVEGEILSSQAVLALDWDGEFSDSSTISSAFTGTGTFMSVDYSYDGSFEVVLP